MEKANALALGKRILITLKQSQDILLSWHIIKLLSYHVVKLNQHYQCYLIMTPVSLGDELRYYTLKCVISNLVMVYYIYLMKTTGQGVPYRDKTTWGHSLQGNNVKI